MILIAIAGRAELLGQILIVERDFNEQVGNGQNYLVAEAVTERRSPESGG